MLRSLKDLTGYKVGATDGDFGSVQDFYFDDQRWAIRYLIVDTTRPGLERLARALEASTRFRLLLICVDGRRLYELYRDP